MGLSRDDFLTYCYIYALLIQRAMLPSEEKLGEHRVVKLLFDLWKGQENIDERQPLPIHSAKAGYNQARQALWIRRREIPGLTLIGKSSLSLVNEGRTFDTMLLRPFEEESRLWARDQPPPPFLPLGLLSETILNDMRRSGMRIDGEKYAFQGAVIQGYEDRVLWLGIRNDKEIYERLEIAARESHTTAEPTSLRFPARMRAAWIRHEDPASVEEYDLKHKPRRVLKEERPSSTPVLTSDNLPNLPVFGGSVLEQRSSGPEEFRVAVDTTLLLAADSFLGCLRFEDPRARSAFWFVVTMYCGCEHLFLKKPPKKPDVIVVRVNADPPEMIGVTLPPSIS